MRPRSRLPSEKRRLVLPTITEGTEETLRDLNEANMRRITGYSQPVSSEDYLLSICHLAHPTFPTRDASSDVIHARQLEAVRQRPRPSRAVVGDAADARRGEETRASGQPIVGTCDPLEFIYGPQNDLSGGARQSFVEGRLARRHGCAWDGQARPRAHGVPRASSPTLCFRRESSCRECRAGSSVPDTGGRGGPADRAAEETRRQDLIIKQSFISQWIADCRSAWREARVRACVLPAIAEI